MMKVKRSERLAVVVMLAEKEVDKAVKAVEVCRRELQKEESRLQDLRDYYSEYTQQFSTEKTGLRASDLGRQREFLIELTHMQDKQLEHISRINQALQQRLGFWQQAHLKHLNLKKLVDRISREENLELDKREQAMLDEWFSRINHS